MQRLVPYDVRASIAHAQMLHGQKLLSAEDLGPIISGLEAMRRPHRRGEWQISLEEEDCHTALEHRLTAMIGEAGGRVHLGRSRNDQVLVALRLYLLDAAEGIAAAARDVAAALDALAQRETDDRCCPATPTCSRPCRAPCRSGRVASPRSCATTPRASPPAVAGSTRTRSAAPPATACPGSPSTARRRAARWASTSVHEPVTAVQISRGKARSAGAVRDLPC